jgi:hypothetical protein
MSTVVDEKYYEVVPAGSLAKRVLSRARDRIYDDFIATAQPKPTDEILDVGVSDIVSDDANVVERKYPYPKRITADLATPSSSRRATRKFATSEFLRTSDFPSKTPHSKWLRRTQCSNM